MGKIIFLIIICILSAVGAVVCWKKAASTKPKNRTYNQTLVSKRHSLFGGGYRNVGSRKVTVDQNEHTRDGWYFAAIVLGLISIGCLAGLLLGISFCFFLNSPKIVLYNQLIGRGIFFCLEN